MTETKQTVDSGFDGLGIKDTILASIKKLGFITPTPIQEKTIPIGLSGQDLIGIAQTGTGKTFAFGIPMLQRLGVIGGRGLILLPTRELALQVEDNLKKLGTSLGLKTAAFIGGEAQERQLYALRKNPHIIIATPGRLIDFLKRKILTLNDIKILVLDEADMMFDLGFAPQVEEILTKMPKERQTMLFSATMPLSIVKLTTNHMKLPVSIETAPSGTTAENVDQEMYVMHKDDRIKHLEKVLNDYKGSVLIFVRTKHSVTGLTEAIRKFGHTAEEIHSNLSLRNRRKALDDFKTGKARVLVATDIAARGLDVNGIELVVNYNLPDKLTDYVHRIGRTGRAGKSGKAISFATPDQARDIRDIEKIINQPIALTKFAEPQSLNARPRSGAKTYSRPSSGSRFPSKPSFGSRPSSSFGSRPSSSSSSSSSYGSKSSSSYGSKPSSSFESKPKSSFYSEPKPGLNDKYSPTLSDTPARAPRSSRPAANFNDGPKKYSKTEGKDNFDRDQRLNHLPKYNNKPDFGSFKFVEDAPVKRSAPSSSRPSSYEGSNPKASKQGYAGAARPSYSRSSARPVYEGSNPRSGAARPSTYEGTNPRSSSKPAYAGNARPSSYHSGRPASDKTYTGPSSYHSATGAAPRPSTYEGSNPRPAKKSDTWTSHSSAKPSSYGAKKTSDGRPARPFRSKSKPGFKKPR